MPLLYFEKDEETSLLIPRGKVDECPASPARGSPRFTLGEGRIFPHPELSVGAGDQERPRRLDPRESPLSTAPTPRNSV